MFDIAGHLPEILVLLLLALLVVGPGKLPAVGNALGQTIREFKSSVRDSPQSEPDAAAPAAPPNGSGQGKASPPTR